MTNLPLPPTELRFMQESDDRLLRTGRELAETLFAHGLTASGTVLDVGCGYGRLALGLIASNRFSGSYLGFDILPKQVTWCREVLGEKHPRFRFRHIDAVNDRYHPGGTIDADQVRFPARINSIDVAAVFSVFTHLYSATIAHYLSELRRVLRPGGSAATTWLLWDEGRMSHVTSEKCAYPMLHQLDENTLYSDRDDPLRAIAFHRAHMEKMVASSGLRVRSVTLGSWDGATSSTTFQDLVVLQLPRSLRLRVRRFGGEIVRRYKRRSSAVRR